ncbi:hypothetical protein [Pseudoxanthomonas sp. PXM01]|uniref:hypothetical protein n=1 Tax=Pseudoxanthomonas sp. PXM01 TaxID=2769295 RepID=UPI00177B6643|nr:hypothetical protein [Pseudoxanthomonas sp. PXM01]MBD9470548.1 hypothetical protein [Pseudoxanthomonas sp. PXM01]
MRNDMFKVIVERPRRGGSYARERAPHALDEGSPMQEGLRSRHQHRRHLNENLRPLERYLHRQVGRPWDAVYSEICAGIDRRSTVQQHIHQHLVDFVAVRVSVIDGRLHWQKRWGEPTPLADRWAPALYVDPSTGLLRTNREREQARRQEKVLQAAKVLTPDRVELTPLRQLHRLHGIWYDVDLAAIPAAGFGPGVADVVRRCIVVAHGHRGAGRVVYHGDHVLYGCRDVYARSKRQLGARELRAHGLCNTE